MSDIRRRDWPIITALFLTITAVFVVSLLLNRRAEDNRRDDLAFVVAQLAEGTSRDAANAQQACIDANEAISATNETNDVVADVLEFLRPAVEEPDAVALVEDAIGRLRANLPTLTCVEPSAPPP